MVKTFPGDQGVSGSILATDMGFFSSGELFYSIYGLRDFVFQSPLSMACPVFSSDEDPAVCLPVVKIDPSIMSVFLYVTHRSKKP